MISLTINDQNLAVKEGTTVLQAAESIGITIPTLCYHKDLTPFGGCRLCVVQVLGARLPLTACILPVSPGLNIKTETPVVLSYRRAVLRMMLSNYYDAGYKRTNGVDSNQDNELFRWARLYGVDIESTKAKEPRFPVDSDPNPFVWVDMNKCIQCTRCVRACAEIQGRFVWSQSYRGYQARIVPGADSTMLASRCESCGACAAYCPTGALDDKLSIRAGHADRLVRTTCGYCSLGCQFDLNVKDDVPGGRVIRVTSHDDPYHTSFNGLHLCLKGRYGYDFIHHPKRYTAPRVRQYLLDGASRPKDRGPLVEVDWSVAFKIAVQRFRDILTTYGGEQTGVLASGRCLNEENYLLNKFARQVLGTNHLDCCAHLYHPSVVDGLMETLGVPAMINSLADITHQSASLFVIGSNLTEQHPVLGAHIRQAVLQRGVKLIVASPNFINLDEYATLCLTHLPHTEPTLINGLIHLLFQKGWIDASPDHRAEFDQYHPVHVAEITGLPVAELERATELLALHRPAAVLWGTGLAVPGIGRDTVHALATLQHLLGNYKQPGGGLNPLRSQNNMQGASDMGCLPRYLPGYQSIHNETARQIFQEAWGCDLPTHTGLSAPDMLAAAREGLIKALYIVGEDILNTTPQAAQVRQGLENCEFVLAQESLQSETSRYADVILPGVSFAEKTGTFTSTERRVQMVNQAISPLGQALPDWQIIAELARSIREDVPSSKARFASWQYGDTSQIMNEIAALTPNYQGITHDKLTLVSPFRAVFVLDNLE